MLQPGLRLRAAQEADRQAIASLLQGCKLPTEDLRTAQIELIVAECAGELRGVVGLERFGAAALLRSLAVQEPHRAEGLGSGLVRALEAQARRQGIRELVLLTQTAERFFARRGYRRIERSAVAPGVQDSGEFRSLCPASAVCMTKVIDDGERGDD